MTKKQETVIVSQSIIEKSAEACADDPNNGFLKCLRAAAEFKEAGLTPMFIFDPYNMDLLVVAKETYNKPLN
jgi:hypothetical protein